MVVKNVVVIGGAGFTGIELVRYILGHPGFKLVAVTSNSNAGKPLTTLYPSLMGKTDLVLSTHDFVDTMTDVDAVFLAVPHTAAMAIAPKLLTRGISVFDLSADFRLKDAAVYEQWYGAKHTAADLLPSAIYGLPEINRVLLLQRGADLIANPPSGGAPVLVACPGCYPTATILATAPALVVDIYDEGPIIVNALSGVSGAGRTAKQKTHYCTVNENVSAYSVASHRHTPEIAQVFAWEAGRPVSVVFTPHLVPMSRGLLSTVSLQLKPGISSSALENIYHKVYGNEPFVQVLPFGTMPQTASVAMSNYAQIGIMLNKDTNTLIASCAIDNLGKGASSQAIQCANIVFGFDETTGLDATPRVI
jgi:N-acetyl-gamma-glutamyl-phosphate reductase